MRQRAGGCRRRATFLLSTCADQTSIHLFLLFIDSGENFGANTEWILVAGFPVQVLVSWQYFSNEQFGLGSDEPAASQATGNVCCFDIFNATAIYDSPSVVGSISLHCCVGSSWPVPRVVVAFRCSHTQEGWPSGKLVATKLFGQMGGNVLSC